MHEPAKSVPGVLAVLAFVVGCAGENASDTAQNRLVYDAWRSQRSHVEVTASGSVARIFGIHVGPSGAHEGFLLHLAGAEGRGLTVRVEDNVDLTGPLDLAEGQSVEVRGEYIFDPRGGIVHYTHRDPRGRHAAGYVRVGDKFYQ